MVSICLRIIVITLSLLLLTSPASAKDQAVLLTNELLHAPSWVFNPQTGAEEGEFAAVGIVKIDEKGKETAKMTAFKWAQYELAVNYKYNIQSMTKWYVSTTDDQLSEEYESAAKILFKIPIILTTTAKLKNHWISPSNNIYVLATVYKSAIEKDYEKGNKDAGKALYRTYRGYTASDNKSVVKYSSRIEGAIKTQRKDYFEYKNRIDITSSGIQERKRYYESSKAPIWVLNHLKQENSIYMSDGAISNNNLFGVGSAIIKEGNISHARQEALMIARSSLAVIYDRMSHLATKELEAEIVKKSLMSIDLNNVRQKNMWISPRQEIFIMLEVDR